MKGTSTILETVGEPNEADDFVLAASLISCDSALSPFMTENYIGTQGK